MRATASRPEGADNYVRWRRTIDEHLELRRLTWDEYGMFSWLCTKASPHAGVVRTSWPTLAEQTSLSPNHVGEVSRTWSAGAREHGHGRRAGGEAVLEDARGPIGRRPAARAAAGSDSLRGDVGGLAGALRGDRDAGSQGIPSAGQAPRPRLCRVAHRHDRAARRGCLRCGAPAEAGGRGHDPARAGHADEDAPTRLPEWQARAAADLSKAEGGGTARGFFEWPQYEAVRQRLAPDLQVAVTVAYTPRWRMQSEVLALERRHLDLGAGTLRLDPGMAKNDEGRVVYPPPSSGRSWANSSSASESSSGARGGSCRGSFRISGHG
jgi:hypothetical protein